MLPQAKFDVFNALTLMDNNLFLSDLKVRPPPLSREAGLLTPCISSVQVMDTSITTCITGAQHP